MQRRSHSRVVSPIVLFMALCATSAIQAQGWRGAGRAKGVILDPAGNAVTGALVTVVWAENEGGGPAAVKSDDKGRWSFVGLVPGTGRSRWRRRDSSPSRRTSWSTAAALPRPCARPSSRSRRKCSRRRRRRRSSRHQRRARGRQPTRRRRRVRGCADRLPEGARPGRGAGEEGRDPGRHRQHLRAGTEARRQRPVPRAGARRSTPRTRPRCA